MKWLDYIKELVYNERVGQLTIDFNVDCGKIEVSKKQVVKPEIKKEFQCEKLD